MWNQPSWKKANKYFGFLKTKQKTSKKKKKNPFLGPNYRNSLLAAQPKLFCICAFRTVLQIACVLHSNHRHHSLNNNETGGLDFVCFSWVCSSLK